MRAPSQILTVNAAIVIDGKVTGIVSAPPGWEPDEGNLVPCGYEVKVGSTWDGSAFVPPALRAVHVAWFKAALAEAGVLDQVDAAVRGLPQVKQVLWEYATTIREDDDDVTALAAALSVDLRAMFDRAEVIRQEREQGT
jgi:hypothetical protein